MGSPLMQSALDFDARAQRDAGIRKAVEHAEDVTPGWSDRAYHVMRCFVDGQNLTGAGEFTGEDLRAYADRLGLPQPPHLRAWGAIFQRAAKSGLIVKTGFTTARAPHVHQSILATWRAA